MSWSLGIGLIKPNELNSDASGQTEWCASAHHQSYEVAQMTRWYSIGPFGENRRGRSAQMENVRVISGVDGLVQLVQKYFVQTPHHLYRGYSFGTRVIVS